MIARVATVVVGVSSIVCYVFLRYSNIFVTSPSPENLRTLFEFLLKGFDSVEYKEHEHYEVIQSTNKEFNHAVVRVNIFQQHRQTVQVGSISPWFLALKSHACVCVHVYAVYPPRGCPQVGTG